jgi:hypothetical protein
MLHLQELRRASEMNPNVREILEAPFVCESFGRAIQVGQPGFL